MRNRSPLLCCATTLTALPLLVGCGDDDGPNRQAEAQCEVGTATGCGEGQVCEEVQGGDPACFEPISIVGQVIDSSSGSGIEGALVVARDANGAAVSGLAETDADGNYSLVVPAPRNSEGRPAADPVTLRADAGGYLTYPLPPRVALPIELDRASNGEVTSAATTIALIARPDAAALGTISGKITADDPTGTLIVAGGSTALAAADGSFRLFNVQPGSVTVRAYRVGVNLESETVTIDGGGAVEGVLLGATDTPTATVSGKIEIVNPGDGTDTSVLLVLQDTFVENSASGEAPPGLRVGDIAGDWSLEGVPDGEYYALAAFENDFLVRDPDTSIGGTSIVPVVVSGSRVQLEESFKVTGALDVQSPDGEEVVSGTPTFVWADDSGEDHYQVAVYDAFGELVWEDTEVPGVSGDKTVSVTYTGPDLETGMVYQFRATSIKNGGSPIARTEDLRGVFRYE